MIIRFFHFFAGYAVLPLALAGVSGCGGAYDAKVSGIVTLDGSVVPRGTVSFQPMAGGPAAYARIEGNGSYVVRTGREVGLPAGDYKVTVAANEAAVEKLTAAGGPPPPGKAITPVWYRTQETSGLKYTVQSGKNEINLELKSQQPPGWKPPARR